MKKCNERSIFFWFFYLETQNLKVRSITETVLDKSKKKKVLEKNFLEPDAFLTKQYCRNLRACNFFAIWVRMLIFFLIDVDIKLLLEFKDSYGKFCPVFPKNPKNWSVKIIGFWLKI